MVKTREITWHVQVAHGFRVYLHLGDPVSVLRSTEFLIDRRVLLGHKIRTVRIVDLLAEQRFVFIFAINGFPFDRTVLYQFSRQIDYKKRRF